jgi:phage shock protein E
MNRLFPLAVLLLLSGCLSGTSNWERVDVETFEQAINDHPDALLLDVRTSSEWEQDGHLQDATLIPHTELQTRESELPDDKGALILLYCRSGNRSQDAANTLQEMGFTNLIELKSGITGWKNAGKSVVYD